MKLSECSIGMIVLEAMPGHTPRIASIIGLGKLGKQIVPQIQYGDDYQYNYLVHHDHLEKLTPQDEAAWNSK